MKTFYSKALKYTAALLLCTATAGCTSFLDEKTYSFVSGDDLYTTAANAELALTGVYDILNAGAIQGTGNQPLWGRGMHYLMMLGDEIAPNGISDPHHQIIASCGYNEEADFVSMAWFGLFVGIDRANHIIQKVPAIDMDPKRRDEIVNEAKLLRGLYRLRRGSGAKCPCPIRPTRRPRLRANRSTRFTPASRKTSTKPTRSFPTAIRT